MDFLLDQVAMVKKLWLLVYASYPAGSGKVYGTV
jgi:hypothetical protein